MQFQKEGIRIAEGIPQLVDLVGTALTTWGAIGTTDPVDLFLDEVVKVIQEKEGKEL